MFHVTIHRQAKDDIARNAKWWAEHHSVNQALLWIDMVERQIDSLSEFPERFGFAVENGIFAYEIRQLLVGSRQRYRVIYSIQNDTVHVLTVQRAEQDQIVKRDLPSGL